MSVPLSTRGAILATFAALLFSGCGDPMGPVPASGSYRLVAIDGDPLPVSVAAAQGAVEVVEGHLRLEAHGRYLESLLVRLPGGSAGDFRDSGAFGGENTILRFRPDEPGRARFRGTIRGDTIAVARDLFFDADPDLEELTFVRKEA